MSQHNRMKRDRRVADVPRKDWRMYGFTEERRKYANGDRRK